MRHWLSYEHADDGALDERIKRLAGNLLKLARAQTGLSQREVAQLADVAQSTIARIESGARQPSLPVLARILAAMDLELRITFAPYDDHDDFFDATQARLTTAQRA
ncbi:helix-turn-helix transcriptional regulator [Mycolicibacterium gadium]|uniref:helix-turn-helix transcriptional regulator n=1 Tax=Mycolicibacterium gadium TaxID=1794 RepID=UPI00384FF8D5